MDIVIREIPDELLAKIDELADREKRTRPKQIIYILEQAVKEIKKISAQPNDKKAFIHPEADAKV